MTAKDRLRSLLRNRSGKPRAWVPFLAAFWPFILGSAFVAGGLAAIVIGYFGVAGTVHVGLQLPYVVSGGLLGLALVVFGSALILVHALGRQARLLRRIAERGDPAASSARAEAEEAGLAGDGAGSAGPDGLVLVPTGAASFHRPGCRLVEGKKARRLKPETAARRGLVPCRLCDPAGG